MNARQSIAEIDDVNMQAIERKNQTTRKDSRNMITAIAAVGAGCLILAFLYIWYFPFYVSNSLSYLTDKMKALLDRTGIKLDTKSDDEAFILLHSINLLENKFVVTKKRTKGS
jgi:hypothetical protein